MNEQYVKIRKDLMETYKMALNRTSFKLLVEATNKFINTFSNSTTKATKNYSMKDFFTMFSRKLFFMFLLPKTVHPA